MFPGPISPFRAVGLECLKPVALLLYHVDLQKSCNAPSILKVAARFSSQFLGLLLAR